MKTTINALRTEVATKVKANEKLGRTIFQNTTINKIEETSGVVKVMNETVPVEDLIVQYKAGAMEIASLKAKIAQLNNTITLSDGKTIQEALVTLTYLRSTRATLERLASVQKRTTRRNDGGMNSTAYYEIVEPNFDVEAIQKDIEEHTAEIDRLELEISNLNTQPVEI